jgi:hypothetical protein
MARQLSEALPESLISLNVLVESHWYDYVHELVQELVKIRHERLVHFRILMVSGDPKEITRIEWACEEEGVDRKINRALSWL